ncbi:hypothetical protein [Bradyrhizobium sp. LB11.1]|uniref:hypothetical protein n=1 Tax=Bradyrhizobium sp. LB11.1 TaxID=3156326 RepID=UPI003398A53E
MFPDSSNFFSRLFFIVGLCALTLPHQAAAQSARNLPCGFGIPQEQGRLISAEYSAPCARYYAPYAIMAAGAYASVSDYEKERAAGRSGAEVAVIGLGARDEITDYAKTLMRGWSYRFGSEGYIQCLHDKDAAFPQDDACKKALPGRLKRFIGSYTGPAFNVWAHGRRSARCNEVSIVFRGTEKPGDFLSNFRGFTDWAADEGYHQLQRNIDAIIGRVTSLPCYRNASTQIVSVGHSLGAGLAEFSAFAPRPGPRIAKVFAFNPSPETGARLIDQVTLDRNVGKGESNALEVDIVYHPGEILEQVREYDQQFPLREHCFPLVRTVRFDVNKGRGLVSQHGIRGTGFFAYGIVKTSNEWGQPLSMPPEVSDCPTRYRRGVNPLVAAAPGQTIGGDSFERIARRGSRVRSYALRSAYAANSKVAKNRSRLHVNREIGTTAMLDRNFSQPDPAR